MGARRKVRVSKDDIYEMSAHPVLEPDFSMNMLLMRFNILSFYTLESDHYIGQGEELQLEILRDRAVRGIECESSAECPAHSMPFCVEHRCNLNDIYKA